MTLRKWEDAGNWKRKHCIALCETLALEEAPVIRRATGWTPLGRSCLVFQLIHYTLKLMTLYRTDVLCMWGRCQMILQAPKHSEVFWIFWKTSGFHCDLWDWTSCFWMVIVCHCVFLCPPLNLIVLVQGILNAPVLWSDSWILIVE
jgi:hypothetical protein